MHSRGESGYGRVRLALSDQHAKIRYGKLSHYCWGSHDRRTEAACGDDRAEEWFLLRAGCEDGRIYRGESAGEGAVGRGARSQERAAFGDGGGEARLDGPQPVAYELQPVDGAGLCSDHRA